MSLERNGRRNETWLHPLLLISLPGGSGIDGLGQERMGLGAVMHHRLSSSWFCHT